MSRISRAYSGVFVILRRYWREYGGWQALAFSPYFHAAVLLTLLLAHYWQTEPWWDVALSVLPNIIGFALGGYAIWLGFGDEEFRHKISERPAEGETSPYMQVSAAFAHFVIVQILALLGALIAKANRFELTAGHWLGKILTAINLPLNFINLHIAPLFWCLGFMLFVYGLMTAIAATLAVFRVAYWFEHVRNNRDKK
jgi:predicted permease